MQDLETTQPSSAEEFSSLQDCEAYVNFVFEEYGDKAKTVMAEKLYLYHMMISALANDTKD